MHIWLAPSAFYPHRGGVEELTHQLARELGRRRHEVLVVAPQHPAHLPRREMLDGIDVARIDFRAPRRQVASLLRYPSELVSQLWELDRLGRRKRPAVVHVQCASVQLPALTLWCLLRGVPLVLTSQGETKMDAHDLYGSSVFMRIALRWAARRAAALTACSDWTAKAAAEIAPQFRSATVVLNAIDPSQWRTSPLPSAPVVCAWGRHVPQKGLDLLIDAFSEVLREEPEARLLVGGDGPDNAALRAAAGPSVDFLGALDRAGVHGLLDASRVAVVPSRLEPFGIVALEAMATGRAVVWSTTGGLGEATGGLGWGVLPSDRGALAAAIVEALRAPDDPGTYRAAAEKRSWQHTVDEYLDIYRSCSGRPGWEDGGSGRSV